MQLTEIWQTYFQLSPEPRIWLVQLFMVVTATVCCNFILMRLIDLAERKVDHTPSIWDNALLEAARIPIRLLAWVIGLSVAAAILQAAEPSPIFAYLPDARRVAFILIGTLFLTRFISFMEQNLTNPDRQAMPVDSTTARAVAKLLRLSVIITSVLVVLQTMGFSISGVLAFGGIGGIAIGFAARDLLSNFFGGLMIYLDKPFAVGDWVRSPDRDIEGVVEDIGWRLTLIRTFDRRPLYIPNSMFATIAVENPSRMTHRRIFENLGLRYCDGHRMAGICAAVRQMLLEHPGLDASQTQIVRFNRYGESHLEFMVMCYSSITNWVEFHTIKEDVLLRIMRIVEEHGAEFAFPTRTLHVAQMGPDSAGTLPGRAEPAAQLRS